MPFGISIGYTLTRSIKMRRPSFRDSDYMSWREFMLKGTTYNKTYQANVKKNDIAVILHSGGTTGTPKGIMISNFSFNALAQQSSVNVIDVRPKDKIVTILPIFHGFGLGICVHTPLCLKVETILVPDQKLLLPQSKTYSNEYALTREPKEKWDEEEAKKYFTVPSSKELNELEKSNDKLIDEILGETP